MALPRVSGEFRCAKDCDLRFAPSGVAVARIWAVSNSRKKNEQGEWVDDKECWVGITGFNRLAENMAESFTKGDLITVTGRLQTEQWEDQAGNKRTSVTIVADTIGLSAAFDPVQSVKRERPAQQSQPQQQAEQPMGAGQSDEPPF